MIGVANFLSQQVPSDCAIVVARRHDTSPPGDWRPAISFTDVHGNHQLFTFSGTGWRCDLADAYDIRSSVAVHKVDKQELLDWMRSKEEFEHDNRPSAASAARIKYLLAQMGDL